MEKIQKSEGVKRVEKILKRGKSFGFYHDVFKAEKVYFNNKVVVARLSKGSWAGMIDGRDLSLVCDGKDRYTADWYTLLTVLTELKLVRYDDAEEFRVWYYDQQHRNKRLDKIDQMKALAKELGYEVKEKHEKD